MFTNLYFLYVVNVVDQFWHLSKIDGLLLPKFMFDSHMHEEETLRLRTTALPKTIMHMCYNMTNQKPRRDVKQFFPDEHLRPYYDSPLFSMKM